MAPRKQTHPKAHSSSKKKKSTNSKKNSKPKSKQIKQVKEVKQVANRGNLKVAVKTEQTKNSPAIVQKELEKPKRETLLPTFAPTAKTKEMNVPDVRPVVVKKELEKPKICTAAHQALLPTFARPAELKSVDEGLQTPRFDEVDSQELQPPRFDKIDSQIDPNQREIPIAVSIKTEPIDPNDQPSPEEKQQLGGGVKRKRPITRFEDIIKVKRERRYSNEHRLLETTSEVQKCLKSCLEITKLLVFNLPDDYAETDLFNLFGHYKSLRSAYMANRNSAVLVIDDKNDVAKIMQDNNGKLMHGGRQVLKIEVLNVMRKYEYGSPLKLVHYQIVKSSSMFKRNLSKQVAIKRELETTIYTNDEF